MKSCTHSCRDYFMSHYYRVLIVLPMFIGKKWGLRRGEGGLKRFEVRFVSAWLNFSDFVKFKLWLHGPKWLSKDGKDPILKHFNIESRWWFQEFVGYFWQIHSLKRSRGDIAPKGNMIWTKHWFSRGLHSLRVSGRGCIRRIWSYHMHMTTIFFWVKWFHHIWPLVMARQPTPS